MTIRRIDDPNRRRRPGVEEIHCIACGKVVMQREWDGDYCDAVRVCECGEVARIDGIENLARFSGLPRETGLLFSHERPANLPEDTQAYYGFDDNAEAQAYHERMAAESGNEYRM